MIHSPPEVVMDKPSPQNGFRWAWAICLPDRHWVELYSGGHFDKQVSFRDANTMLAIATREWENDYNT